MTKTISIFTTVMIALALMVAALLFTQSPAANAQAEVTVQDESSEQAEQETTTEGTYTFTAQVGDSYSKIARKTVQIYGIENNVVLSGEQIVFAETNLTQEAGSPELNEGQTVELSKESVKSWVDKAKELSDTQQTAWTVYVQYVDFDTNNVGE